jgi:hypothetical protein
MSPMLPAISYQPPSLLFTGWLSTELTIDNRTLSLTNQLLQVTSLNWTTDNSQLSTNSLSKSKSHCDWQSVSQSWCRAPSGAHDLIFITVWHLQSFYCGASSLTRGRVCLYICHTVKVVYILHIKNVYTYIYYILYILCFKLSCL